MNRIEKLRLSALNNVVNTDDFYYHFFKCYDEHMNLPEYERYALAYKYAFSNLAPSIDEGELIVGKYSHCLTDEQKDEMESKYRDIARATYEKAGYGQDSHMAVDYELILSHGLEGIISKIEALEADCDEDKKSFYTLCKECLRGVILHSEEYAKYARAEAEKCGDENRKKELENIADICDRVPAKPARSFYEAIQSVHFVTYCLSLNPYKFCCQQFQLGHPDRYLLPYYQSDIRNGVITKEYAQLLLDCLGIQINNRVPAGLSSGYMVGGRDEKGNIVANDLTLMCMQTIDNIRLVFPSVGLCYTDEMEDIYIDKAVEILSHGCSHPAIFNDDVISEGLMHYGVPEKDAHNYIHSTCVEITPVASSNVWVASPYTNMPQILLDIMDREYDSFDQLLTAYFNRLDGFIKANFEDMNSLRIYRAKNCINPLLSCFVDDCLARGRDIEKGGARYNWTMPSFVGVANLVDAFAVIRELVFDKKEYTIKELSDILDADFDGNEDLRLRILNTIPKYGNDIDSVDSCFGMVTEHIINECAKYKGSHDNSLLIPSVFCWEMHERFGRETGATPDGRRAGFPLGDGSGPCQGREFNGPTASILSSTKWSHYKLIGGVAVNMKFSKKSMTAYSGKVITALVKAYMQRGGFEIQINVTDSEILKKAIACPDEYRDLVVRVGGYSDYFVRLSPEMQQELLLRTEHLI